MTRSAAIASGLVVGVFVGLVLLALFVRVMRGGDGAAPQAVQETEETAGVPDDAGDEDDSAAAGGVKTLPVTVYQRAGTRSLLLKPAGARIVWFDSPVERARQLVRHVIDGVRAEGAVRPAPSGMGYNDVYVDDNRIAWVDLAGEGTSKLVGADMEEALVACLTRTLVDNLNEVQRVGILVDGEPRRTLAGHVDISRTFTGREWPTL
ncbi:MAG: GerMN domain-containing protein [Acidobacteriota bacterium]|nr:GerMN domain-containing protein [Acidobacteriota bacterium]